MTCPCRKSGTCTCATLAQRTSAVVACGLVGGYTVARATKIRPLGGIVLGAAGLLAGKTWLERKGPATAGLLGAGYLAAFGLSHPLAKKIGAWPSVAVVTVAAATAAHVLGDE